jgi:GTP pyrophosphokinase/guanosine-3',5'-bis(diphosphate) 3'-pyrophosphohydrolase
VSYSAPASSSSPSNGSSGTSEPERRLLEYDYEDPAYRVFIDTLSYLPPDEVALVCAAYRFSDEAHQGQTRLSGEPYITHPLAVAGALAEWRMDVQAIVAALLHDVMEDTAVTKAQIAERFGKQVADLVDGLSKLDKIEFQSYQDAQAENFRKMLMAMASDLRIVLIKLADRRHNLQTMAPVRPEKRRRIAHETLEIYAPIATRLGLNNISRQLQDLSFRHIHPLRFAVLSKAVKAARGNRRELLTKILEGVHGKLAEAHIEAGVFGREKSLYSIYRKMVDKHLSFSQVLDIYGFRVIVKDVPTCYLALGALHSLFKPVPGKFKDYIAIPKVNGYQSLHTTLIGPYGTPIEIQIRTQAMHHLAEEGIASHWLYKDTVESGADLQDKMHVWLQSLLELQSATGDSSEFLEHVKVDLFPDEVYVFTPKGQILALPRGATVIDFAYAVHTDIGHRCVAARIDHELIPLSAELANGNQVEIITAPFANPNPAWLGYVKTSRARSRIRQFLRGVQQEGASALGEKMLNQELRAQGIGPAGIPAPVWEHVLQETGKKTKRELYSEIGLGRSLAAVVARRLAEGGEVPQSESGASTTAPLLIRGTEGMAIQLATCCQPIPGDPIIGLLRKDQGLRIHTHACPEVRKSRSPEPQNWIHVEWEPDPGQVFDVRLKVTAKNVLGVLGKVSTAIAQEGINIGYVNMDRRNAGIFTDLHFLVQVTGRTHLALLMRGLRRIPEVVRIVREQESS